MSLHLASFADVDWLHGTLELLPNCRTDSQNVRRLSSRSINLSVLMTRRAPAPSLIYASPRTDKQSLATTHRAEHGHRPTGVSAGPVSDIDTTVLGGRVPRRPCAAPSSSTLRRTRKILRLGNTSYPSLFLATQPPVSVLSLPEMLVPTVLLPWKETCTGWK